MALRLTDYWVLDSYRPVLVTLSESLSFWHQILWHRLSFWSGDWLNRANRKYYYFRRSACRRMPQHRDSRLLLSAQTLLARQHVRLILFICVETKARPTAILADLAFFA